MKKILMILGFLAVFGAVTAQMYVVSLPDSEFNCTIISTATALTVVTGCDMRTDGKSKYITGLQWSSSIISTTTNFLKLTIGTTVSTACDTSARDIFADFASVAFAGRDMVFSPPIKTDANDAICFIFPGAGTRNINIQGYIK